jgi:MoxR-like ATPase
MTGNPKASKRVSTRQVLPLDDQGAPTGGTVTEESTPLSIDDVRLDALRPNPLLAETYVSRTMPNGKTDVEYLLECWERRENVLLVGDTQGGKTMLMNVLAIKIGERMGLSRDGHVLPVPVFTLSASNGITDFDLFGQTTAWTDPETGVEHLVWLPGTVDLAARVGGLLYLDEVNMMPERVTSSLHPCTDWRRSFTNRRKAVKVPGDGFVPETVNLSPDLWITGTMNPNYKGAGTLNEAFSGRFRHLDWSYDPAVERRLVPNDAVRTLGDALRQARATGHIKTPIGTASLMRVHEDAVRDGVDMALYCLTSAFTADERLVVEEIIESRSFKVLIENAAARHHPLTGSGADWDAEAPVSDDESPF